MNERDYSFEVFVIFILFLFSLFLGSCLLLSYLDGQRELELKALEYREKKELIQAVRDVFGVGEAREDSIFTPPTPPFLDLGEEKMIHGFIACPWFRAM